MPITTAGRPRALRRAAVALAAAAVATSAVASSASAAVFYPAAGDVTALANAITTANTNTDSANTIIIANGAYNPTPGGLPAITKNLTMTADHSVQALGSTGGGPKISGGSVTDPTSDLITINAGVTLNFIGITVTTGGSQTGGGEAMRDNGTLNLYNAAISGENSHGVNVAVGATLNAYNSIISDNLLAGVANNGTANLDHVSMVGGYRGAFENSGTLNLKNTVLYRNNRAGTTFHNCQVGTATTFSFTVDSDGTCTGTATTTGISLNLTSQHGGPTPTDSENSTSTATLNQANPATCPSTDQRFFVNPATSSCDIGSYQFNAAQQTALPSCTVTGTAAGPPKTQTVTITDNSGAGLGSQFGNSAFDPGPGSTANPTGNPQALAANTTTSVVSGLYIDNGTVAFSAPTAPSTQKTLAVTATKNNQSLLTHWSFTATDWAGNRAFCK